MTSWGSAITATQPSAIPIAAASHFGAATLKLDPEEYLQKDFAALMETMALASGMKLESENKNVPTGLES